MLHQSKQLWRCLLCILLPTVASGCAAVDVTPPPDILDVPGQNIVYPDDPNDPTKFSWDYGEKYVLIRTSSDGATTDTTFYSDGAPLGITVHSEYSQSTSGSMVTERFEVTQIQDVGSGQEEPFQYVLEVEAHMRGALVVTVSSGDLKVSASIDSETGELLHNFPEGYEEMFFAHGGPLDGMDPVPLRSFVERDKPDAASCRRIDCLYARASGNRR